jgi:nucleoid-associated protein YgaU
MQTLTVAGGNLFDIAQRILGDATKWDVIADANDISDPWLAGLTTLLIPDQSNDKGAIGAPT